MKWIKKSNSDPWETREDDLTGTKPKSGWKRVCRGVILCVAMLLAGWMVWTAMNGGFTEKAPQTNVCDDPSYQGNAMVSGGRNADVTPAEDKSQRPGEDLIYKGVALGPEFLGNVGGGSSIGEKSHEYPFTLAEVLEAKGETPTLKLLQKNRVPYVYDENGNKTALFTVISVVADQGSVNFDELELTDNRVVSCRPLQVELPATIYLDDAGTMKFVMFNDSLYLVSGDEAENASASRYDWQIFGADAIYTTLNSGIIERMNSQTFGDSDRGILYKPGEKPTVRN